MERLHRRLAMFESEGDPSTNLKSRYELVAHQRAGRPHASLALNVACETQRGLGKQLRGRAVARIPIALDGKAQRLMARRLGDEQDVVEAALPFLAAWPLARRQPSIAG